MYVSNDGQLWSSEFWEPLISVRTIKTRLQAHHRSWRGFRAFVWCAQLSLLNSTACSCMFTKQFRQFCWLLFVCFNSSCNPFWLKHCFFQTIRHHGRCRRLAPPFFVKAFGSFFCAAVEKCCFRPFGCWFSLIRALPSLFFRAQQKFTSFLPPLFVLNVLSSSSFLSVSLSLSASLCNYFGDLLFHLPRIKRPESVNPFIIRASALGLTTWVLSDLAHTHVLHSEFCINLCSKVNTFSLLSARYCFSVCLRDHSSSSASTDCLSLSSARLQTFRYQPICLWPQPGQLSSIPTFDLLSAHLLAVNKLSVFNFLCFPR